jgi:hypothetical protein
MHVLRVLAGCALAAVWSAPALAGPPPTGGIFVADYNADGKADIARQGAFNIQVDHLDGTMVVGVGSFANGGGGLQIRAVGDVDANENADIAVQGVGTIRIDKTNVAGTGADSSIFIGDGGGAWIVVGLCDINGDGIDEVITEGTGTAIGAMRMSDISTGAPVNSYISTAGGIWQFLYCLDANGDGDSDLYFNGVDGAAGTTRTNLSGIGAQVYYQTGGGVWQPTLSGDTNGDGIDDLVDTGVLSAAGFNRVRTLDNAAAPVGQGFIGNAGDSLVLTTSADHNNDDRFDLGYQGVTSNRVTLMAVDGISEAGSFFTPNAGGTATLNIAEDTNGDGNADLISIFTNEDVFLQTVASDTVSGSAVVPADSRVLFVP